MDKIKQIINDVIIEYGSAEEAINAIKKNKHRIPRELHKAFTAYERILILYAERGY